jgi:hypothetical protein
MVSGIEKLVYYNLSLRADRFAACELVDGYKNMTSEKILTKEDAEKMVIEKLNKRTISEKMFSILKDRTIEKSFGCVFICEETAKNMGNEVKEPLKDILTNIINKYSHQVLANSTTQPVERIISLYENLLIRSKAIVEGWCLSLTIPRPPILKHKSNREKLKEKAIRDGFYEIS